MVTLLQHADSIVCRAATIPPALTKSAQIIDPASRGMLAAAKREKSSDQDRIVAPPAVKVEAAFAKPAPAPPEAATRPPPGDAKRTFNNLAEVFADGVALSHLGQVTVFSENARDHNSHSQTSVPA